VVVAPQPRAAEGGAEILAQGGNAMDAAVAAAFTFRHGNPYLLVGALGGSVIISAVLQTILNVVDFGMSSVEAVSEARLHCEGGAVHLEPRAALSHSRGRATAHFGT
jgi:gamma-glutamyltranspeptidase